jgi:4-carboxymuconolactone decarboxylase
VFDALLHHPRAMTSLRGFLEWGDEAVLSRRERELLILRTVASTECSQELSVHRVVAVGDGLISASELGRALSVDVDSNWSKRESLLLLTTDAICQTDTLSDELWLEAVAHFRADEIIEALVVIGYYRMVSGLQNGLGVPAESDFVMP